MNRLINFCDLGFEVWVEFHVVKPERSSLGLWWWETMLQTARLLLRLQSSITELDGVWIMIPSLKLKKGKWKLLGSSLTIASCCPFSVWATSLLTPIYCPGMRINWNRITVLPLLPESIVKYWVTAIFSVHIITFGSIHKFRHAVNHNGPESIIISSVEMTIFNWIC